MTSSGVGTVHLWRRPRWGSRELDLALNERASKKKEKTTMSEYTREVLDCPICDEETEIKPCKATPGREQSYTFRCPGCGTRSFLRADIYDKLKEYDKIVCARQGRKAGKT